MAIISLSEVKTFLGISGNGEDGFLTLAVAGADAAIKSYLKRCVETTTVTEELNGNGRQSICLKEAPVQSITSVRVDIDRGFGDDTLIEPSGYSVQPEAAILHRIGSVWPGRCVSVGGLAGHRVPGQMNVKVVYVAGWAVIPGDIKLAAMQYVAQLRMTAQTGGPMASESLDYYSYSSLSPADQAKAFGSVKQLLSAYKRVVF